MKKIASFLVSVTLFLVVALPTNAQVGPILNFLSTPFGGIITGTLTCTCSGNLLVYVFDYRTFRVLSLVVSPPFSKLYNYSNFSPRIFSLGSYSRGPQCMVTVTGSDCETIHSDGAINSLPGAGTSLIPMRR